MRQGPHPKRSRGRGNGGGGGGGGGGRKHHLPLRLQTFDSNGPDVRIRGNAYQVHEKYLQLARDASAAGDRVAAENYFQHAEHYFRIISADLANSQAHQAQAGQLNGNGQRAPGDPLGMPNGVQPNGLPTGAGGQPLLGADLDEPEEAGQPLLPPREPNL